MNSYASIGNFGPGVNNSPQSNPLSYCTLTGLDSGFMHTLGSAGTLSGPGNAQCQLFMAQYCATNPEGWNGICEYMSQDTNRGANPNTVQTCNGPSGSCFSSCIGNALTNGQILIRNTAQEKYLVAMSNNCQRIYEPFDPTVAGSPMVSKWMPVSNGASCGSAQGCSAPGKCIPIYAIKDPKNIDNDPVMNKVLAQPWIATDILVNIYNNAMRNGTLQQLVGTKLYRFFMNPQFQQIVKSGMFKV